MKKLRFLPLFLTIFLFAACASSSERAENNRAEQNANQALRVSTTRSAEMPEGERSNAFANLESEGTNLPMEKAAEKAGRQKGNAVCPDPSKPCTHKDKEFSPWEMSFRLPARIQNNKAYSSAPFYAVMLETYELEDCDGGEYMEAVERERKELQKGQLDRKVFAYFSCPNMDAVGYDFEGKTDASGEQHLIMNFLAIYAGETEEEAEVLRRSMRDEYPKAVVKRMTASWERIVQ